MENLRHQKPLYLGAENSEDEVILSIGRVVERVGSPVADYISPPHRFLGDHDGLLLNLCRRYIVELRCHYNSGVVQGVFFIVQHFRSMNMST